MIDYDTIEQMKNNEITSTMHDNNVEDPTMKTTVFVRYCMMMVIVYNDGDDCSKDDVNTIIIHLVMIPYS